MAKSTKVDFLSQSGQPLPYSDVLFNSLACVSGIQQVSGTDRGLISMTFIDHTDNSAFRSVQKLLRTEAFKVLITWLSDGEPTREVLLDLCSVTIVLHDGIDSVKESLVDPIKEISLDIAYKGISFSYPD